MVSDELNKYYERTLERGAHEEVYIASRAGLKNHSSKAVDLGCGVGVETEALLTRMWEVHAVDRRPEALKRLRSRVSSGFADNLTTEVEDIREFTVPHCGLVVAMNSLFSFDHQEVRHVVEKVRKSLCRDGIFCMNLLSRKDDWKEKPDKYTYNTEDIHNLFENFKIISKSIKEYKSSKFWSTLSLILKK